RMRGERRVALPYPASEEVRIAKTRRNVEAAYLAGAGLRRRVGLERFAGTHPSGRRAAGIEGRDFGVDPGDEVVVERSVVILDHVDRRGDGNRIRDHAVGD